MTTSFGSKNISVNANTSSSSAGTVPAGVTANKKRKKRTAADYKESRFSPELRIAGKIILGLISMGTVAFALWALFTHQAPFMTIFLGMFVFAMILVMIGQLFK